MNKINHWIFDLDNTLYPAHLGIIEQARAAIMEFMVQRLKISPEDSRALYREFHVNHHSALRGLVKQFNIDPKDLFASLPRLNLSHVQPDLSLAKTLSQIQGQKIIFTNATRAHAQDMLQALGILDQFDHIYDIEIAGYIPKPVESTYINLLNSFKITPQESIFFEDVPRNLKPAYDLGMVTALVRHNEDCKTITKPYIHHYLDDIQGGLQELLDQRHHEKTSLPHRQ